MFKPNQPMHAGRSTLGEEKDLESAVMSGRFNRPSANRAQPPERKRPHLRPVWIVLILLVPCVALTLYYSQIAAPDLQETGSFLPTTSYALVLLLVNLDLIGLVVLVLLLSEI
jgi:two-component system, NtrC family, nitrogen regulation sensor histidine kinase NtrY